MRAMKQRDATKLTNRELKTHMHIKKKTKEEKIIFAKNLTQRVFLYANASLLNARKNTVSALRMVSNAARTVVVMQKCAATMVLAPDKLH
jgi:hypothetical protein